MQRPGPPQHPLPNVAGTKPWFPGSNQAVYPSPIHAVTAALANPYARSPYNQTEYTHPHHIQGYMQPVSGGWPLTTSEGYTLSSTYVPGKPCPETWTATNITGGARARGVLSGDGASGSCNNRPMSTWYCPGDSRCTYRDCSFTGSQKSVEIHMMDRHLIYPQGLQNRKRKSDWDADPSLRGKIIPIQGTNVTLDTPEALEAWIAERKKRWPSSSRVQDQKKKREEAVARGQISVPCSGRPGRVRGSTVVRSRSNAKPWLRPRTMARNSHPPQNIRPDSESASSSDENDDPPEIVSSKAPTIIADQDTRLTSRTLGSQETSGHDNITEATAVRPVRPPRSQHPKKLPHNPFASRPSLLRNLLLPEIRMTVSNLSQAIRFLVENDFLSGVELTPGEAGRKLIEIVE